MPRISATSLMPDFTGFSLDRGRYRLVKNVGCGAFGKVYRAVDLSHHSPKKQTFAIKCLSKPRPNSREYILQQRELENHKLVSGHPNIVTFHQSFSDGLFVYVVLDFCGGGDLFTAITEKHLFQGNGPLVKSAFLQLIDAVAHCHRLGVYHRDIKPENILCSDDGSVIRLTDFGLSIMSPFSKDLLCGSSHYMSPECLGQHIRCEEYATSYNDIWAMGIILTNMITARSPWNHAVMQDECFAEYMSNNDYLKQTLPITDGVYDILRNIFTLNPTRRPTLAKLRSRFSALDALCTGSPNTNGQLSNIIFISDTEVNDVPAHVHGQSNLSLVFTDAFRSAGSQIVPVSDSSGSSGSESKGPITPPTRPVDVDPPVDIPDISSAVLGDPVGLQKSDVYERDVVASVKVRRPADIFRAAIRRINIFSRAPVA